MSYRINTSSLFVIDGDETNAGERAFIRDTRLAVIDGAEVGTAGLRQFLKDFRMVVLTGGPSKQDYESLLYTCMYEITGHGNSDGIALMSHHMTAIDGISPNYGPIPVRSTSFFTIEDVPQEATP